MTNKPQSPDSQKSGLPLLLKIVVWPFSALFRVLYDSWLSYLHGKVLRDNYRIYSIKFIWYGDSVYLHPMIWGSLVLFFVAKSDLIGSGWPVLMSSIPRCSQKYFCPRHSMVKSGKYIVPSGANSGTSYENGISAFVSRLATITSDFDRTMQPASAS